MNGSEVPVMLQQQPKAEVTMQARAAMAGLTLEKQANGTWLAGRWGRYRLLTDATEVERFLLVVGAPE